MKSKLTIMFMQIKSFISKKISFMLSLATLVFTLSGCSKKLRLFKKNITITAKSPAPKNTLISQNPPTITVYIHGTRFFGSLDDALHSPKGLHHISELPKNYYYHKVAHALESADPIKFPQEHFYTFGWPGSLSFKIREQSGTELYKELNILSNHYQQRYQQQPTFRLISHSHGGNVILNMAKAHQQETSLTIAETILMACPVQHETEYLIKSPLFNKIHSIYSTADSEQVLDIQGLYKTPRNPRRHIEFSRRRFEPYEKLSQARIKLNNRSPVHLEFITPSFFKLLPTIVDEIDSLKTNSNYDQVTTEALLSFDTHKPKMEKQQTHFFTKNS